MRVYISRLKGKGDAEGKVVVKIFLDEGELLRQISDIIKAYLSPLELQSPTDVTPDILKALGGAFPVVDIAAVLRKSPYCVWVKPFVAVQTIERYGLVIDYVNRNMSGGDIGEPDGTETEMPLNTTDTTKKRWLD